MLTGEWRLMEAWIDWNPKLRCTDSAMAVGGYHVLRYTQYAQARISSLSSNWSARPPLPRNASFSLLRPFLKSS